VSSLSIEHWSLRRSLAFLAAVFAIMLGSLLPTAVAASAATGSPVVLCSGDQIIVYDVDGAPRPEKPTPMDSLKCASCIVANFAALPPPPPVTHAAPPSRIIAMRPALVASVAPPPAMRAGVRPPPTAPPIA
jgi:hypothetical protein